MHHIVDIILGLVEWMGYFGIFIMMTIESSFIPFPSEVAMVPAGYLASLGRMSLLLAFIAGTLGAIVGSSINYFGGRYLGWPIVKSLIHSYGKYIFLHEEHYKQSEKYFRSHGAITTLLGRFIPAVRQLISIPAGIFRMNYMKFLLYTTLGAGAWNAILLGIGYVAGKNDALVKRLLSETFLIVALVLISIVIAYVFYVKSQAKKLRKIEKTIEHNTEKQEKKMKKTKEKKHSKKKK